jgi:hypothetical protein
MPALKTTGMSLTEELMAMKAAGGSFQDVIQSLSVDAMP